MKQIFVLLLVSIFGHPGKSNHWLVRSPLLLIPRGIASFGARTPPLSGCKRLPDTRAHQNQNQRNAKIPPGFITDNIRDNITDNIRVPRFPSLVKPRMQPVHMKEHTHTHT